jgi:signal transduction histidine kinase
MVLDGRGEVIAMKSQPDDAPASEGAEAVRFTAAPTVAPWSVQIEIPGYVYRSSLLTAIVAVSVGILVATLAGLAGGRIAARGLSRSVAALTEPSTAGSPASKILEIDAARRVLEESRLKREASEEELKASQTLLRRYTAHLQETIETERLRIARELHDDLGQRLSALKMDLGWVKRRVPPDPPSLTGKLDEMAASLSEVVGTTRRICADLRPGVLDDLGLGAALEVLVSEFRRRQDVEVSLRTDAGVPVSEKLLGAAIYRIVQEALTNALRHSGASEADVWLRHERERLVLSVTDNGRGLSPDAETHPQSFGIIGMRERVNSLGGTFELASGPRGGTRLVASFPISSKEH